MCSLGVVIVFALACELIMPPGCTIWLQLAHHHLLFQDFERHEAMRREMRAQRACEARVIKAQATFIQTGRKHTCISDLLLQWCT